MMARRLWLPAVLLVGLVAALAVGLWWPMSGPEKTTVRGGDFELTSAQGPVKLEQLRGKVVVLYFGYTWCPDVCPTSLAMLGLALHKLTAAELDSVQPIFISVDPDRDTVERLAEYTHYFHPRLLGATGTAAQIADIARRYGVVYAREAGTSPDNYIVNHSSLTFILGRDGKLRDVLPHGTSPDAIVAAMRRVLAE